MPGPTHPSIVNNTELLSKGVIEALTYTFKYNTGNNSLPMTDGQGGWNMAFLYKTFEGTRNREVLVDFVKTRFSPIAQSGNIGDIFAIQVRDNITGKHLFGFSGTEINAGLGPMVNTIGSDVQLVMGVTWAPGSPYQTIYNGLSSWLGQRLSLMPAGTSPQLVGQSLGGYIARDMAQALGLPMSDVTLFQAPGEFGLFGSVGTLATFGIFNDGNYNYVRSPDLVTLAGLGSRYIYLGGELSTDGLAGPLIGAHGMNKVNDALVDLARSGMSLMGLPSLADYRTSGWLDNYTTYSIAGVSAVLMNYGSQTYLVSKNGGNLNGFATVSYRDFRNGNLSTPMAKAARDQASGMDARVLPASNLGAQLGTALGSSVGVMLGGSNPLAQIGAGTLLGAIGSAFGQWLDHDLAGVQMRIGDGLAQSFGQQLQASFQSTGIQVVSSQLTNIAMQAIGVTGFGGQLAGVVVNTAITQGVQLALSRLPGLSGMAPSNFMGAAKGNVAAFFGAKLGSLVVSAQTQAGSILGSLGSTLGQIAARQIFVSMGWMAGPVGAFIGTVLGTLIGNLFGRKKPKIPTANAEVYLNYTTDRFEAGPSVAANGGNLSLVKSMASSAEMTLNGFVQALAGEMPISTSSWSAGLWRNGKLVDVNGGLQTFYGHTGGQLWVKLGAQNAAQQNVSTADDAVSRGVLWSLAGLNVIGGDIFAKRALANSSKENISILLADLQVAEDYAKYRRDYHTINAVIAQNPNSALTAGWIQTFQRAGELKLNDWSKSDFHGGLQGFVTSMGLETFGVHFENVGVYYNGGMRIHLHSVTPEGALSLLPQADSDGRGITITDPSKVGYTRRTTASSGNDFVDLSATTTAGNFVDTGGDDIVVGGSGNDTLSGMAGWDWLNGGLGNDLLDGGDGNDILIGHDGQDRLVGGAGDDYLAGGSGHDRPLSTNGNAGLYGGDGNDTLIGGAGLDGVYGEAGDDTLLVDYNDGQADFLIGGAGSDTLSFERWAVGVNFTMGVASAVAGYFNVLGDQYQTMENVTGTRFNDTIVGDAGNNVLFGGDGNDVLDGAGGNDNTLEGGAGADTLRSTGDATLSYQRSTAGVFIDMTSGEAFGGHATGDRWSGMDHLTGSGFADELKGDAGSNRIKGLDGDDWIVATKGSDIYDGGEGLDTADYSTGFSTGTSTYEVWVEDGYLEWDDWLQQDVWVSTGEGHYETVTTTRLGLQVSGGIAEWRAVDGTAGTHNLIGVEHIIGTAGADSISMGGSDDYIAAGKGNDTLSGGAGGDTYYFDLGDGIDTIGETNIGTNVVSFGAGIGFNQLTFTVVAGPSGYMTINYSATDSVRINGNLPNVKDGKLASADDNRLKTIDMNGSGQLDVSQFEIYRAGTAAANTISGIRTLGDFIAGFGGNDTLYGMQPGQWEDHGNIIIGGAGNDTIYTSGGDDQFAFERGSGRDTINDAGGEDVLVFGPNVAADDVIYKVVGNDLYIGIAEAGAPQLEAYQVTDYVRVINGGVKWEDAYGGGASFSTVEFINAGGTWIDLRKLDLNWTVQSTYNGGVMPIVFDLDGDGLELTGVESSMVVSRLSSGQYARTSWVGPTNGILAFDRNGDGQINNLAEISFVQDREGAKTDLEGLQAWDTNGDGKLNALDAGWSNLKMWVDRNQNGRSTEQELRTLEEVGIVEIDLKGVATGNTAATTRDSFVHNTLSFTWASGEKGTAYDVQLARRLLNELGLSAEQVRAAWGDGSALGELGRLASHPTVAAAARAVLGAPTDPVSARAGFGLDRQEMAMFRSDPESDPGFAADPSLDQGAAGSDVSFDFSDHDGLYAEDEVRWSDVLNGTVRNEGSVGETDARVRATLEALQQSAGRGAFGQAFGRPDIEDEEAMPVGIGGQSEAQRSYAASYASTSQVGSAERVGATGEDGRPSSYGQLADIDQAANLLSAMSDDVDVWAPAEFSRASTGAGRQWWRSEALSPDDLSVTAPVGTLDLSSAIETHAQGAAASQHQQLVQALAAFGPKAGGGNSAIWKRSGEVDEGHLAGPASEAGRWRFAGPSRIHA